MESYKRIKYKDLEERGYWKKHWLRKEMGLLV